MNIQRRMRLVIEALCMGIEITLDNGYTLATHPDAAVPFICFKFQCFIGDVEQPPKYVGGDDMHLNWLIKEVSDMGDQFFFTLAANISLTRMIGGSTRGQLD